ncbi:flap endonuclease GEN-like 1 [Triticum dicoccoides]|uniref:flap endonuclease GEN-like 1 n=1 Tax=Triticum dicoccoides TaxID=85692 RepID=UPI00188DDF26|nr:flap endonuclease GEN-like 1 [Triticum dicoccoides]
MGVRGGFWKVLQPYARQQGMGFLRGRRVAVDLSSWIVSAMSTKSPTLRNIFFRTLSLFSKMGAFPVFVLDGVPSPLKAKATSTSEAFTRCVHECVVGLNCLGMPILRAKGEAEALCAQLNRDGKVDACITSDSDAFLCGANTVIKVFSSTVKEPFECYNIQDIQDGIGLSRKRMIAMALLIGCDYDLMGVPGVGLETALAFVQLFHEEHILDELRAIGKGIYPPAAFASQCRSLVKARDLNWKINVCKRLAAHPNFPNEEIIKLYLCDDNLDTVKRIKKIHGNPHYLVQWKSHADDRMFLHTDEDVQLVDEAFPNEARRHKWLKGRVKSGANRNQLLVPNKEKSRANNMSKTPKGARPRPSRMQLSIKDFYRSKKPHVEMGETSTRKSSPVSQRRRLLLG